MGMIRIFVAAVGLVSTACDPSTLLSTMGGGTLSSVYARWNSIMPLRYCVHPGTGVNVSPGTSVTRYLRSSGTLKECLDSKIISTCDPDTGTFQPPPALSTGCQNSPGSTVGASDHVFYNRVSTYAKNTAGGTNVPDMVLGGAMGTIVDGPVTVSGKVWWKVDFERGGDGWMPAESLTKVSESADEMAGELDSKPGVRFDVEPLRVPPGGKVRLRWSSSRATSCKSSWGVIETSGEIESPPIFKETPLFVYCTDGKTNTVTKSYRVGMGYALPKVAEGNYGGVISNPDLLQAVSFYNLVFIGAYHGNDDVRLKAGARKLKELNPNLRLGKYVIMVEQSPAGDSGGTANWPAIGVEVEKHDWWLRTAAGGQVTWTPDYNTFELNLSHWAAANQYGDRPSEFIAKYFARKLYNQVEDIDFMFMDNLFLTSFNGAQIPANWRLDGVDRTALRVTIGGTLYPGDPEILAEQIGGTARFLAKLREEAPSLHFMGNGPDNTPTSLTSGGLAVDGIRGQMEGNYMECMLGKSYSAETWASSATNNRNVGWERNLLRYRSALKNTAAPHDVLYAACYSPDPARPDTMLPERDLMRYGLATTMLDDGWFVFSAGDYSSAPTLYDEFLAPMGRPAEAPPESPIFDGAWMRKYENGLVLVNPRKDKAVTLTIPPGYRRLSGTQDPDINNGQPVSSVTMAPRSGLLLLRQ